MDTPKPKRRWTTGHTVLVIIALIALALLTLLAAHSLARRQLRLAKRAARDAGFALSTAELPIWQRDQTADIAMADEIGAIVDRVAPLDEEDANRLRAMWRELGPSGQCPLGMRLDPELLAILRAFVAKNVEQLQELATVARSGRRYRSPVHPGSGVGIGLMPDLAKRRSLSCALAYVAICELYGDTPGQRHPALRNLLEARLMAWPAPDTIAYLVLCVSDENSLQVIEHALAVTEWGVDEVRSVREIIARLPERYTLDDVLLADFTWRFEALREREGWPPSADDPNAPGKYAKHILSACVHPGYRERVEAAYLRWAIPHAELLDKPIDGLLGSLPTWQPTTLPRYPELASFADFSTTHMALDRVAYTLSLLRMADVALAAEEYRLTHGVWPADLDALVPEFLDAVPNDARLNQPVTYEVTEYGVRVCSIDTDTGEVRAFRSSSQDLAPEPYHFRLLNPDLRGKSPRPTTP